MPNKASATQSISAPYLFAACDRLHAVCADQLAGAHARRRGSQDRFRLRGAPGPVNEKEAILRDDAIYLLRWPRQCGAPTTLRRRAKTVFVKQGWSGIEDSEKVTRPRS